MYSITDLKKDTLIELNGVPYRVVDYQHAQQGRGGAVVKTKLNNLINGGVLSKTFKGNDKIQPAQLNKVDLQYLYTDQTQLQLMDKSSYEQYSVERASLGAKASYLVEGQTLVGLIFNGRVVDIELPKKMVLKIKHTEPGIKGNTATTALKPAVLEGGAKTMVPLFIKPGDKIEVDTRTGKYVNRAQ